MASSSAQAAVPRGSWAARFKRRQRLKGSLWMIPLACALAGPVVAEFTVLIEGQLDLPREWTYSEATASSVLSAIVGAMVGLTGFVVAFGVLVVQMATQTLSPRFMRLWYRDNAAEGGARNLRRDAHVRAGASAPHRPRLGPGHRRDDVGLGRRRQRRALPRLSRPVHPPSAAGRGGLARCRRRRARVPCDAADRQHDGNSARRIWGTIARGAKPGRRSDPGDR